MLGIYLRHPSSLEHDTGAHPENAGRLRAIEEALSERDWLGLELVEAPAATREQLERVHTGAHIDAIAELSARGGGMIDMDTVASAGSYEAALHAAGGAVHAVDRLLGARDAGFAFCGLRPPGHHAERARAMGFCLFNNVAVAAATPSPSTAPSASSSSTGTSTTATAPRRSSTTLTGSSTRASTRARSIPAPGRPATPAAAPARATNLNLPVPPGAGRDEFVSRIEERVVPTARALRPGLIAISAGYDAHRDDPLADCTLETADFGEMSSRVRELGEELGAPVLICLEGGYAPGALAASVVATLAAFD